MRIDRLIAFAEAHPEDIPPLGYERKPVRYTLRVDQDGNSPSMIDLATEEDKRGKSMFVPTRGRPSGDVPLLLCDHADYILGMPSSKSAEQAIARYWKHAELVRECAETTGEHAIEAVLNFLTRNEPGHPVFPLPADFDPGLPIVFEVVDGWESIITIDLPSVRAFWARHASEADEDVIMECLTCGELKHPVRNQPVAIKQLPGGNPSGSKLISADNSCYESYGLERARIAPMCEICAHKVGSALNLLLSDEQTHIRTPTFSWIFWTDAPFEFTWHIVDRPDPAQVRAFLQSVVQGRETSLDDAKFYTASVAGKRGRLAVRDWTETTLSSAKHNIAHCFQAMHLVDGRGEDRWFPLWQLARATIPTTNTQSREVPQTQVEEALLRFAFHGLPLPSWLAQRVLRRTSAEGAPKVAQVALLKMFLLSQEEERKESIMAELNTTATDKAYLCGRLLATLEEIHEAAISGVGKSVMERFYTRASTAPAFAFGILMQRVVPHLAKLERDKPGLQVLLSKQLQEIVDLFEDPTFPQTFDIPQQALFAIGYWQQRSFDIRAAFARKAAREAKTEGIQADETDTLQIPLLATEAEEETTL